MNLGIGLTEFSNQKKSFFWQKRKWQTATCSQKLYLPLKFGNFG
jgi:hypothetical protein